LVVPTLIGNLQLQKDVLEELRNLYVEIAVVQTIFREKHDDDVDYFRKTDVIHEKDSFFPQLLLPLAQTMPHQSFVTVVDPIFLAICLNFGHSQIIFYLFEQNGENHLCECRIEIRSDADIHFDNIPDYCSILLAIYFTDL
jgi:hypothetical protein